MAAELTFAFPTILRNLSSDPTDPSSAATQADATGGGVVNGGSLDLVPVTSMMASTDVPTVNDYKLSSGYATAGDGGFAAWVYRGNTLADTLPDYDDTADYTSKTCVELGYPAFTDANGNLWELAPSEHGANLTSLGVVVGDLTNDQAETVRIAIEACHAAGFRKVYFPAECKGQSLLMRARCFIKDIKNMVLDFSNVNPLLGSEGGLRVWGDLLSTPDTGYPKLYQDSADGDDIIYVIYDTVDFFAVGDRIQIRGETDANGTAVPNANGDYYEERSITAVSYDAVTTVYTLTLDVPLEFAYEEIYESSASPTTDYTFITKLIGVATGDMIAGSKQFVDANGIFSIGDLVLIGDSYLVGDVIPLAAYASGRKSEIECRRWVTEVADIDGTTVTLADPVPQGIEAAYNAGCYLVAAVENVHVVGGVWTHEATPASLNYHPIHIKYGRNCSISNAEVYGHVGNAFRHEYCHRNLDYRNNAHDPASVGGGEGYGVSVYGCRHHLTNFFTGRGLRHTVLYFKGSTQCKAVDCLATDGYGSNYDVHGAHENDIEFVRCVAVRGINNSPDIGDVAAFRFGNSKHWGYMGGTMKLTDCEALGAFSYGLSIQPRTAKVVVSGLKVRGAYQDIRVEKVSSSTNWADTASFNAYGDIFVSGELHINDFQSEGNLDGNSGQASGLEVDEYTVDGTIYSLLTKLVLDGYHMTSETMSNEVARFRHIPDVQINNLQFDGETSDHALQIVDCAKVRGSNIQLGRVKTLARIEDCPDLYIENIGGETNNADVINASGTNISSTTGAHVVLGKVTHNDGSKYPLVNGTFDVLLSQPGRVLDFQPDAFYPQGATMWLTQTEADAYNTANSASVTAGIKRAVDDFAGTGAFAEADWE